jgi:predicted lipoprotein
VIAVIVAGLAVVRPWSVRPLHTTAPAAFEPRTYAEQVWPKIVDEASRDAVDIREAAALAAAHSSSGAPGRRSVFLRATGTVSEIDRRSRVGVARIRLAAGEVPAELAVQVGPVVRGTALRDATSFIRFTDFANQFDFAAVSNALHERVLRDVVGRLDLDSLVGQQVTVIGATALPGGSGTASTLEVVPLLIHSPGVAR